MQTTKRVVLPILLCAILRGSKMLKSLILLWLLIMGAPILSKAQVTFSSPGLPPGLEFTGGGLGSVQVADLNGDGYSDIIYNTSIGGGITYLQNNAGASFSTPASNPFGAFSGATPAGVVITNAIIADFDRDGDNDIWMPVAGVSNDFYLRNDGSIFVSISLPSGMEFTGAGAGSIKVADINQDGYPDIIYNAAAAGAITYLQNNGWASFSTPAVNPFSAFTAASPAGTLFNQSCDIADYDGDGDLDVWVRLSGAGNDVYLRNDAGTYVSGSVLSGQEFSLAGTAL
ncbi:FG-GAP repeat domain-containing protein [Niabella hibiscisoli]|uniref:FG-GAP repeat domain-containing protein n=1 Tax=Niabella hibiscisoli TaxID=1825928 RepID=UPI001F104813|nr:VCBS repeat-containing protein [Niabella hibiscisoli]MCH5720134.1 VCBS repeat-containing protein [Niabella hibiscisoli]